MVACKYVCLYVCMVAVPVAHTEEEKFWGCSFCEESVVKFRFPRRAEGALLAQKMMILGCPISARLLMSWICRGPAQERQKAGESGLCAGGTPPHTPPWGGYHTAAVRPKLSGKGEVK